MRFALVLGSLAVGISGALALDDLIISSCYSKGSNCVTIKNPKLDHCFKIEDSAKRGDVGSFFGIAKAPNQSYQCNLYEDSNCALGPLATYIGATTTVVSATTPPGNRVSYPIGYPGVESWDESYSANAAGSWKFSAYKCRIPPGAPTT